MPTSAPVSIRSVTIKFFKLKEHEQRRLISRLKLDRPGDRDMKDYELVIAAVKRSDEQGTPFGIGSPDRRDAGRRNALMAAKFDFIQSYRDLDPNASRDLIEARQKAHELLDASIKNMEQVYDLCRLAYLLEPHPATVTDWFEKPIRGLDPHFFVNKDKVDAGQDRRAASSGPDHPSGSYVPLAVLSASFCGRRHSADGDALTTEANEALYGRGPQSSDFRGREAGSGAEVQGHHHRVRFCGQA